MKLFRFKGREFKDIEQITLDDLDLEHRKTLFVFPGSDNASSIYPPPPDYDYVNDPDKYDKIKHLLERGVIYTQDAMRPGDEPFQVVLASWDGEGKERGAQESIKDFKERVRNECSSRLQKLKDDPSGFADPEARAFVDALYKRGFNPNKMSFLAWSYGTCFVQECANAIRLDKKEIRRLEKLGKKIPEATDKFKWPELPPIYTICTATLSDMLNTGSYGFPGFYMYAHNDKRLEKYTTEAQKEVYGILTSAAAILDRHNIKHPKATDETFHSGIQRRAKGSSAIVVSQKRPEQAMAIILAPNHCLIKRRMPVSWEEFNAGVREKYNSGSELVEDSQCHRPGLFSMARPGSQYIHIPKSEDIEGQEEDKRNEKTIKKAKKYNAHEHSRYFMRCMLNILTRDKSLTYGEMLLDDSREQELFMQAGRPAGQSPDHITREIRNRLAHIEITQQPDGKYKMNILYDSRDIDRDYDKRKKLKALISDAELERLKNGETVVKDNGLTRRRMEIEPRGRWVNFEWGIGPGTYKRRQASGGAKPDDNSPSRE